MYVQNMTAESFMTNQNLSYQFFEQRRHDTARLQIQAYNTCEHKD